LMTLGMMSRVSLGHTGRDISQPPSGIGLMFAMLRFGDKPRVNNQLIIIKLSIGQFIRLN